VRRRMSSEDEEEQKDSRPGFVLVRIHKKHGQEHERQEH
jgi:hypothetical protein